MRAGLCAAIAALVLLVSGSARADDVYRIRVATLAPKQSAWGKVFRVWEQALEKKTKGRIQPEIFYNSVQGDEDGMVGKLKSGQLDGAALTSVGLSRLERNVMVLQLPFVVDSWELLDKARAAVAPDIEARLQKNGYSLKSWGDVGLVRQMTRGYAARSPQALRGHRPAVWRNEPMAPKIYAKIGGVVPVPLSAPEVLPALRAKKIDSVSAPALAAEQLQWTPYLTHISKTPSVCAIGGSVFRTKALEQMPADLREIFVDLQKKLSRSNAKRIRRLDAQAYERLAKKMTVVDLTAAERETWRKLLAPTIRQHAQTSFDKTLIEKVLKATGKG